MLNEVRLIGRLGKEPDVRPTQKSNVVKLNVATWEIFYDEVRQEWSEVTEWHNVECWSQKVDRYQKMKKGDIVVVFGKIVTQSYVDKQGVTKYRTIIQGSARPLPRKITNDSVNDL